MAGNPPDTGSTYPSHTVGRSDGASLRFTYTPEDIHIQRRNGLGEVLYEFQTDYTEATEHMRPKAAPPAPKAQPERQIHPGTEGNGNTLGRCVAPVPPSQVAAFEANPEVEDETPAEREANRAGGGNTGGAASMPASSPPGELQPPASSPPGGLQPPPEATPQPPSTVPAETVRGPAANLGPPPRPGGGARGSAGASRGGKGNLVVAVVAGVASMVGNVGTTHRWETDGTQYDYTGGIDGGTIDATHPDGTVEHFWLDDISGTISSIDADGRGRQIISALGEKVDGVYSTIPVSPEDALGYRQWQANGGEGTYQDWMTQGKPESPEDSATGKDGGKVKSTETRKKRRPRQPRTYENRVDNPDGSTTYTLKTKNGDLVDVTYRDGYPDFSEYLYDGTLGEPEVVIEMTGDNWIDFPRANEAAGFGSKPYSHPSGYIWHHHQDGVTMQLVQGDVHAAAPHTGGASGAR